MECPLALTQKGYSLKSVMLVSRAANATRQAQSRQLDSGWQADMFQGRIGRRVEIFGKKLQYCR